jgi:hypothetical protein
MHRFRRIRWFGDSAARPSSPDFTMNLPDVVFGRDRYRISDTWNFFFARAVCKAGPPEIRRSHMVHSKTVSGSAVGLGIAEAFAHSGANVVLNGFGDALQIEKSRTELAHGSKATDTSDRCRLRDIRGNGPFGRRVSARV